SLFTSAPRFVQLGALAALGCALPGCVSARHYEEARSVAESETAAHGRTRDRLEAAVKRIHALEADLAEKQKTLSARESDVAQSKLDTTVAQKERDAVAQLVDQLRSELARTGDHLTSFSREKRELTQTLLVAEQRMQSIELAGKNLGELVAVTRDLALELEGPLEKGGVELGAKDGQVFVAMPAEKLFAPNGTALLADAAPVLEAVGKVSGAHPKLKVVVREPSGAPLAGLRSARLGDALREHGVADSRLTLPFPAAEPPPVPVSDAEASSTPATADGADAAAAPPKSPEAKLAESKSNPAALRYEIAFAF
ncbi:MAG TPA: hypothetical protein VGK73_37080, partial [Polyangiaceae bacterium]